MAAAARPMPSGTTAFGPRRGISTPEEKVEASMSATVMGRKASPVLTGV